MNDYKKFLAILIFVTLPCAAQTLKLYDDFNHKFIDPSKWGYALCFSGNGLEMECVREINDGQLHLTHRHFGVRVDDGNLQNGSATMGFANANNIKAIRTDVTVRSSVEVPCAANPSFGSGVGIWGKFFNAGSGDPNDDVGATVNLGRHSYDPPQQLNLMAQVFHAGIYTQPALVGSTTIGTPVTISASWDQPNHQFTFHLTNKATHVTTSLNIPYTFSDTTLAADPGKVLEASGWASDCAANATSIYVDAVFANVYVAQ